MLTNAKMSTDIVSAYLGTSRIINTQIKKYS